MKMLEANPASLEGMQSLKIEAQSEAEEDLNPSIWQDLPLGILEEVLTKLPVFALKKFCRVSKQWKAIIESDEFAHRCESIEPTVFYYNSCEEDRHMAIPNPTTNKWEKHVMDFIPEGERVNLVAVDRGLICYKVYDSMDRIILVVHNPLRAKWRRLVFPYNFTQDSSCMLVGLRVDQQSGNYVVVIAFMDSNLPRKTVIYDSPSDSWKITGADAPTVDEHFGFSLVKFGRSFCCGDELFWLVEEFDEDSPSYYKTLVKYNVKGDMWKIVTEESSCDETRHCHLASFKDRPFMVNFGDLVKSILFSPNFLDLAPTMGKFDATDVSHLLEQAGEYTCIEKDKFGYAVAEGEVWFVETFTDTGSCTRDGQVVVLALGKKPASVERSAALHVERSMLLCSFAASFKAFV